MAYLIVGITDDCPTEEHIQLHHIEEYTQELANKCQERFDVWAIFNADSRIGTQLYQDNKLMNGIFPSASIIVPPDPSDTDFR